MIIHLSANDWCQHVTEIKDDKFFAIAGDMAEVTFITLEQEDIDQMGEGCLGELG